ncbi:MAG: hypothetical protein JWP91_3103 [Fibrobacteres bacterium]|nr:hypothetical protein [Fibrobacterota bacterium]
MHSRHLTTRVLAGLLLASPFTASPASTQAPAPRFRMIVIGELKDDKGDDEIHKPYVEAGTLWLNQLAKDSGFAVTYLTSPNTMTDSMLAGIDLIWQMNYTPYRWTAPAKAAFEKYMNAAKGGWVGDHHASLYGPVLTTDTWPFFAKLIGEVNYKNYISKFASGNVRVEAADHEIFKGVPASFNIATEEWYIWDKNPRSKVHVLANVDESSYKFTDPAESGVKMGDHPVIWTYDGYKARNLYIFMGHHPNLFQNTAYTTLLRNALFWAANKPAPTTAVKPKERAGGIALGSDTRFITLPAGGLRGVTVSDAAGHALYRSGEREAVDRIDRSHWGAGRYLVQAVSAQGRVAQWLELR